MRKADWLTLVPSFALVLLAGCHSGEPASDAGLPGDAEDTTPYSGIADDAVIRFTGTEPFWGGTVTGDRLTWSTPEIEGEQITVTRFAGRGGLTFSGTLGAQSFDMALTPGKCSDGMSDRNYPFHATVRLGAQQLSGCAWREGDDLGDAP